MIEVRQLSKRFGETLAVDGLDFTVQPGEILGFLGPNGAGKTTTMRILTGFFPPSAGTALVNGHDVVDQPLAARRAVGYLPENVPLYVDMRVKEYLDFVGGAKGLDRLAARREAGRVMEALGIEGRAGQLIKQLSKGFRQRVGLAQALVGDPPVLILDEPTIGLDPGQIVEIRSLIKHMAGQKTVILSSHILPEVAATCQRVVIINQGRLVAQGPPSLLAPGSGAQVSLRLVAQGEATRLKALLAEVAGVLSLEPLEAPPGLEDCSAWRVTTASDPAPRAALARAVVEAGLGLLELSPLALSLEEVFVQLTTQEAPAPEPAEAGA
ncbi:MAG: ATP-binding cassette domain-containing protein [Pseudomonadota bacterium]